MNASDQVLEARHVGLRELQHVVRLGQTGRMDVGELESCRRLGQDPGSELIREMHLALEAIRIHHMAAGKICGSDSYSPANVETNSDIKQQIDSFEIF